MLYQFQMDHNIQPEILLVNKNSMETFNKKETEPKILTGQEGLDLLKASTSKIQGISLVDFLETPKGKEMIRSKKIVLAGPPRSGKSCFRQGVKGAISAIPNAPYPYMLTACPDGEGSWFQEAMNADPAMAAKLKAEYKSKFTPEFTKRISDSVNNLTLPLNFIDIGGIMSPENEEICSGANGAVILSGQSSTENDLPGQWKDFFTKLGIPVIAEIYSDYNGQQDLVEGVGEDGVFRGSVHHLERGEQLNDRETIKAFSEFIVNLGNTENQIEGNSLSIEQIEKSVGEIIASWQEKLPEVEIVLGGSLVSGLFILDEKTKVIDVDLRFLTDEPLTKELQEKIESVTGLSYRKTIDVSDWPNGQSKGYMIEGKITLPNISLPLDVEGCLRNKEYVGWGKFYKQVLTPYELASFVERKKMLREDKVAYKALKQEVLRIVMGRCIEQGLVTAPQVEEV
jgi:CRISPR-associated protein Csx3